LGEICAKFGPKALDILPLCCILEYYRIYTPWKSCILLCISILCYSTVW